MRIPARLLIIVCCSHEALAQAPKPRAYLRFAQNRYYIAVFPQPPLKPGAPQSDVVAALFKKGQLVTNIVSGPDGAGAAFTLAIPDPASLGDDPSGLAVTALRYPTDGGQGSFTAGVTTEIKPAIDSKNPRCYPQFALDLSSDSDEDPPSQYVTDRFSALGKYISSHSPAAVVESRTRKGTEPRGFIIG